MWTPVSDFTEPRRARRLYCKRLATPACLTNNTERGYMATTTRKSHKKLKPKPKTESKSWQTRNTARKEKQTAHAATLAAKTEQ